MFRKTSLIDYTLGSPEIFPFVKSFKIIGTHPLFSDGHSILSCTLNVSDLRTTHSQRTKSQDQRPSWNNKFSDYFYSNIN